MAATNTSGDLDGAFEHEGLLWKPKPDATSTWKEFLAARDQFVNLNKESIWNPWVLEDRADDIEQAMSVMDQWVRAEPGHRTRSKRQIDAMLKRWDREFDMRRAVEDERCKRDSERYDSAREAERLVLLEKQSDLAHELEEATALRSGESYAAMDATRRGARVAELEDSTEKLRAQINRLGSTVGDPEDVVDKHGRLPRDRRAMMLTLFSARRSVEVRELRVKVPELAASVKEAKDKEERAEVRRQVDRASRKLDRLLAIPPLTADDMCSECATPAVKHGWRTPPADGPCPAWPGWAARLREVRRTFETIAREGQEKDPEPAKPNPLAVVPSGLPIAEIIDQLTELQAKYPNSEVRCGRSNRWELWPNQSIGSESR